MMKKYTILCFALLMLVLESFEATAMGPVPLPYPAQNYQTNPAYRMTAQQRIAVSQAFAWAQSAFQKNHSVCRGRTECLNLDLKSLTNYVVAYPRHPATLFFKNIYNIILSDSQRQKFVSEWVIFQYLSPLRQSEYRGGVRVTPIQPQYARAPWGRTWISTPAFFNQDDVLTDLLQTVDHYHKNCNQFITCLRGDLQIIGNLDRRLAANDPVRASLRNLSQNISNLSQTTIFNTSLYLNLYNPLSPDWNNMLTKHKANKLASYGYTQWRAIEKSSRASNWRTPRITNGTPITQSPSYGVPMTQNYGGRKSIREWWGDSKNYFKQLW